MKKTTPKKSDDSLPDKEKKSMQGEGNNEPKPSSVIEPPVINSVVDPLDEKKPGLDKEKTKNSNSDKKKVKTLASTPRNKSQLLVTSVLFLIAVSASAFAAYDYWLLRAQAPINAQLHNSQAGFEDRLDKLTQQLQTTTNQLQTTKNQLTEEVQARMSAQSEHQAVNTALQSITEKLGRTTVAWRMAEVEYLLTVANHRLTLAQDRKTAIAIFETADSRLKAIGDPSLLKVRQKVAFELTALRAMPNVDIPGLAVQIGSLAESVDQLPLLDKKRLAPVTGKRTDTPPLDWQEIPSAVWDDVKSLVQVRRHKQPTEPLLPPNQAWFLYKNLQLKLEQARLAVLKQNTALFGQSLEETSQWIKGYFEPDDAAVISMQATLKKLQDIELQPTTPDVSSSLRELRNVMKDRSPLQTSLVVPLVTPLYIQRALPITSSVKPYTSTRASTS